MKNFSVNRCLVMAFEMVFRNRHSALALLQTRCQRKMWWAFTGEVRKFTCLGAWQAAYCAAHSAGWGVTGQRAGAAMVPITSLISIRPWLPRYMKGGGARIRTKSPLPCRVSGFGGCACRNFGVRSEGTRFHLGASRRHGSHQEPDEWEARDIQAV